MVEWTFEGWSDDPIGAGSDPELVGPVLVAKRAQDATDAVFLQEVDGTTLTYGQFHESALRWADALRRHGVGEDDKVGVFLRPVFEAHLAWFASAWLKAQEVPYNTDYRGRMLSYVLNDSTARIVFTSPDLLGRIVEVADELDHLETVVLTDDPQGALPDSTLTIKRLGQFLEGTELAKGLTPPQPDDIAQIVYTSGTTGPSKGVLVPWAELSTLHTVTPDHWEDYHPIMYSPFPINHLTGTTPVVRAARLGGTVVMREVFSGAHFWQDCIDFDCTDTVLVGAMANFLMQQPEQPGDRDNPLRWTFMAPAIPSVEEFEERFGVKICVIYGMTEIGWPLLGHDVRRDNHLSCGKQRPGYDLKLIDPDTGEELGANQTGELIVRAHDPVVMNQGYFNKPEKTTESWEDGWFRTGDGFRFDDDGNWYFVDRLKDAIRRRGENISSFEVEAEVNNHPDVLESAAVAVPSEHTEDEIKVVVVPKPDATVTPEALLEFLIPRMPRFMIPRYVEIVDELPKTASGKIRKLELRDVDLEVVFDREAAGIVVPR
ncbi:MAG TPA: AMP-binding protein [Nitriliruptorales bacterium]